MGLIFLIIGHGAGFCRGRWCSLGVALLAAIWAPLARGQATRPTPTAAPTTQSVEDQRLLARGLDLYQKNCAACHGAQGLGDGAAAYLLYPKPRNFSQPFRLVSNNSGIPTDEDLLRTLQRGMPGSAMPPWNHLPDGDLKALVRGVRELALRVKVNQVLTNSPTMRPERAMTVARNLLDPGPPASIPPKPAQVDPARGAALYTTNCAACHGADGRGRDKRDMQDNSGYPIFARDFTAGIFKGGSDPDDLARRLVNGMPGSPMPGSADLPPEDLWALVGHVQGLIKPGAQARIEQRVVALSAGRVAGALNTDPDSPQWDSARPIYLAVMPLWWRDDRIEGVNVRALHDGRSIALQVSWDDPTVDDTALRPQDFTDGVAIQLAADQDPPLFAMGEKGVPVNIWHWKATRQHDLDSGVAGLDQAYPNMSEDAVNAPQDTVYQTSAAAGNIVAPTAAVPAIECLYAGGFGTLTSRGPAAQTAQGMAKRTATGWKVVFLHRLGAEGEGEEIVLEPGRSLSIAFAVWDGAVGDRNGQKSVTIWHGLNIEK